MTIWQAIGYVSSGFTLVAFIVAAAAWAYRYTILGTERRINSAPAEDRAKLVEKTIEISNVDTAPLTRQQKYDLALQLINTRAQKFRTVALVVCFLAILGAVVAIVSIVVTARSRDNNRNDGAPIVHPLEVIEANLYGDDYAPGNLWTPYDPSKDGKARFWVGLHVHAKDTVTIDRFRIATSIFTRFYSGYSDQVWRESITLYGGDEEWISVPIETDQWSEWGAILASPATAGLIDTNGNEVVTAHFGPFMFPHTADVTQKSNP
jgi:hypothetical protein